MGVRAPQREMTSPPIASSGYYKQAISTAAAFGTIPPLATSVLLRVETNDVRWRDDGTDPTATDGMLLKTTDAPFVYDGDLEAIKFVAVSGSPVLHANFYGDA